MLLFWSTVKVSHIKTEKDSLFAKVNGSLSWTSSAQALMRPSLSAAARAISSTRPPLAVFTMKAPTNTRWSNDSVHNKGTHKHTMVNWKCSQRRPIQTHDGQLKVFTMKAPTNTRWSNDSVHNEGPYKHTMVNWKCSQWRPIQTHKGQMTVFTIRAHKNTRWSIESVHNEGPYKHTMVKWQCSQ